MVGIAETSQTHSLARSLHSVSVMKTDCIRQQHSINFTLQPNRVSCMIFHH